MRHPLRGLLIGPLAAPVAYWIGVLIWDSSTRGASMHFRHWTN